MKLLGIVPIVFGVVALVYQGVTFLVPNTTDLGLFSITVSEQHSIPLSPIVGGIALIAGILLVLNSGRRRQQAKVKRDPAPIAPASERIVWKIQQDREPQQEARNRIESIFVCWLGTGGQFQNSAESSAGIGLGRFGRLREMQVLTGRRYACQLLAWTSSALVRSRSGAGPRTPDAQGIWLKLPVEAEPSTSPEAGTRKHVGPMPHIRTTLTVLPAVAKRAARSRGIREADNNRRPGSDRPREASVAFSITESACVSSRCCFGTMYARHALPFCGTNHSHLLLVPEA